MNHKSVDLIGTKADEDTGSFVAWASVFGNVDKGGDRMLPGSFSKTLRKRRESGKPIPIILSHQWDSLDAWVGKADPWNVRETDRGLEVAGELDLTEDAGRKVHRLMKDGLLTGWSFGYTVPEGGQKRRNGVNEVSEVELFEVGPTLVGMNPEAQLQSVKSGEGVTAELDGLDYHELKAVSLAAARSAPPAEDELDALRSESMELVRETIPAPEPEATHSYHHVPRRRILALTSRGYRPMPLDFEPDPDVVERWRRQREQQAERAREVNDARAQRYHEEGSKRFRIQGLEVDVVRVDGEEVTRRP